MLCNYQIDLAKKNRMNHKLTFPMGIRESLKQNAAVHATVSRTQLRTNPRNTNLRSEEYHKEREPQQFYCQC
jgi:hypothetical protein